MPTASVSFEFSPPLPAVDVLAWLAAAFAPAALTRAPAAWLGDDPNPTFLGPVDPLVKGAGQPRLKLGYGPGGALSTSGSYLAEIQFAPAASVVAALTVWPPNADYQPVEPFAPAMDHDSVLAQFQTQFSQRAGRPGSAYPTRQSAPQAAAAAQALVAQEGEGSRWQVQMLRRIPSGQRSRTPEQPASDTWVVRFASPGDKEAMLVVHVDDATGVAARG